MSAWLSAGKRKQRGTTVDGTITPLMPSWACCTARTSASCLSGYRRMRETRGTTREKGRLQPAGAAEAMTPAIARGTGALTATTPSSTPYAVSRIVAWNIRAGGGRRAAAIADQLRRWHADLVVLCEFRATPPSAWLAEALAVSGLPYQDTTADRRLAQTNALLVASRWPMRRLRVWGQPVEPARWLLLRVEAPAPFAVGAMHIPTFMSGGKRPFLDAVAALAERWRLGPALFIGDTNTGRRGLDEETPVFGPLEDGWMRAMDRLGWTDAFRHLHAETRAFTWYSPNGGNGFRLDEAFLNRGLLPRLRACRYVWGLPAAGAPRRDALSDHAALLVDLAPC
jgi:hypothetical protein